MTSSDNKKRNRILIALCLVIIVAGIAFIFFSPGLGISFGSCISDVAPLTSTSTIPPTYNASFLQVFGEPEPEKAPDLPLLADYPMRREIIDPLMDRAEVNGTEASIIGLYEFPDSRLLLINNNTTLTEVIETGDGIRTFTLVPGLVGSRHTGADETGLNRHRTYNASTEDTVTIHRIDLILLEPANKTARVYLVNKTRTDTFLSPDGAELLSVSTTGTFYVLYGQRVDRVLYGSAISHDPGWKLCSQQIGMTKKGTTGELRQTVRFARGSERVLHAHLLTTGAFIQVFDGSLGSTNQWNSRDSTGCRC